MSANRSPQHFSFTIMLVLIAAVLVVSCGQEK